MNCEKNIINKIMDESFLKKIDFIGVSPRIFYKGDFRYKTSIGGFLSLGLLIFVLIISSYFFYIFISRKSFTIYENIVTISRTKKVYSKEDFSIIVLDKYYRKIENSSKIYSIYADIWTDKRYKENGTLYSKTEIFPISIEKCNISTYENYDLWKNEKLINDSICFSEESIKNNINSTGVYGETGNTGIVFWISLCTNNTFKNDCYPFEKSKEILDNVFIYVKLLDVYFNHNNLKNNAVPYIRSDLIQASSSIYKREWYLFQEVEYMSDEGILFFNHKKKNLTTLSSTYNSIDDRHNPTVNNSFFALSLNMDGTKKIINRKYYKIQDLFSDINGLFQLGYIIVFCLNYIYCYNRMNENIINENICNYIEHNESNIVSKHYTLNGTYSLLLNGNQGNTQLTYNQKTSSHFNKCKENQKNNFFSSIILNHKSIKGNNNKESTIISQNCKKKIFHKNDNHKFKFNLSFLESFNVQLIFCPKNLIFSKSRNLRNFAIIEEIILNQIEVNNLIQKINLIDKFDISFFSNENRNIFHHCFNPLTKIFIKNNINQNISFKKKHEKENETNILKEIINKEFVDKINIDRNSIII